MLLKPTDLHDYQKKAILHQLYYDDSMLWLGMSLGKTVITLTTIAHRMKVGQVKKTLVFAPVRVIYAVWEREALKWSHLQHLRFSIIHGNEKKRSAALFRDADIYLCNYENMAWLSNVLSHYYIAKNKPIPFEMCVYDECSRVKNSQSQRIKGDVDIDEHTKVRTVRFVGWRDMIEQFKYRTGLTGTPSSNGYTDLHGQYLCVDNGIRLGKYITHFRNAYCAKDWSGFKYVVTQGGKDWIHRKIADITIEMATEDYITLPETIFNDIEIELPAKARKIYEDIEEDMFTRLDNGTEIELFNRASVSNKCLQVCGGTVYNSPDSDEWTAIHDAKLLALDSIIEEAAGNPVAVSYNFVFEKERIVKRYKRLKPVVVNEVPLSKLPQVIEDWKEGKIQLLIGHPACVGADTLVLTELRGWIKIVNIYRDERVFDGVEFVNHEGCVHSGCKEITDFEGLTLTPDHKLLVNNKWVEVKDVKNNRDLREKAFYKYEGNDKYLIEMCPMRSNFGDTLSERHEAQPIKSGVLPKMQQKKISRDEWYKDLEDLVRVDQQIKRYFGQKLWWSWNKCVRRLEKVREFLSGYVTGVQRGFDYRESQCEQGLQQGKLCVGYTFSSTIEQKKQQEGHLSRERNAFSRAVSGHWDKQDNVDNETKQRDDGRSSSRGYKQLSVSKKHKEDKRNSSRKKNVYDLVNCGKRNRFIVKSSSGELFISHNSMGHGVDGLQDHGDIVVWFGLNWSLELYDQMNARFMRQGRIKPLTIHRLLCPDTVDMAVKYALEGKRTDEQGLKDAINKYRGEKKN